MNTDLRDRLQTLVGSAIRIERELGGGGMSRVFIAHDTGLDRRIVIKVLPPELAGAAHGGNSSWAQEIEAELARTAGLRDMGFSKMMRARIAAHLGERDRAVGLLAQARAEGVGLTSANNPFRYDPLLLPLKGYAPFEELVKPKG